MINIDNIISLSESVEIESVETEGTTAYGIWTVTREVFRTLGMDFTWTSQYFYNMSRNGKINGVKGTKRYTDDEVESFVARMVAKARIA